MLRWSILLCLLWSSLILAQDGVVIDPPRPLTFGDVLIVNSSATTYVFPKSPSADRAVAITVRSTTNTVANFTFNTFTRLTDGVPPPPDSFTPAIGLGGQGGGDGRTYFQGYLFNLLSTQNVGFQGTATTPGLTTDFNLIAVADFQIVFYDPLTLKYSVIQSTFDTNLRTLTFSFSQSGFYFVVFPSIFPSIKPIGSTYIIAGNTRQTVYVSTPTSTITPLLTVGNVQAASSGILSVNISAAAATRPAATGATLISQVYSIGLTTPLTSAVLEYNYQQSGANIATPSQLSWYQWSGTAWTAVPSTIQLGFVVASTTTLGEWSVQSSPQTNSPSVSTVQGSSSLQLTATFTGDGVINNPNPPAGTAIAAANSLTTSPFTLFAVAFALLALFFNTL